MEYVTRRSGEKVAINMAKFKSVIRTNQDLFDLMHWMKTNMEKSIEAKIAIEESDDKDYIEANICILEELHREMSIKFQSIGYPPLEGNTREDIRNGVGDLASIQKKCVEMGIV